ncbi:MAG: RsiV family protein, partial [Segatella copri]
GWTGYTEKAFTEKDFPLTHFAVLPEGIVLTYHPYQIDCFAAGEYHAVIPFKEANRCLMFDYSKHEDLKPKLQRFIKW